LVANLGATLTAALAQAQGPAQTPAFRSDLNIVEVGVIAKDSKDSPLTDLKKSDLRVFDNGVEQTILSFEKLGGSLQALYQAHDQTAPRAPRRLTVILIDALNADWATQIYGREGVSKMLEKLPQGVDRIAIFTLGDDLKLLHDFSADTASLRRAVDHYDGELPMIGVDQPPPTPFDASVSSPPPGALGLHAPGLMAPKPQGDPAAAFFEEQRMFRTMDALKAIARIMKAAPGEKNLLWVTAGFGLPNDRHAIQTTMGDLAAAKLMLYPIDARGVLMNSGAYLTAKYLGDIAELTGGRAYINSNDVAGQVRDALDDSREGYFLTYAPRGYRQDGSPHLVQLKTARKGVKLRYRPGYVADRAP
jgi:VWFA-related protein